MLHQWLSKLATQRKKFQGREPTGWTPQLIQRLERVNNPMSRDVNFWVDSVTYPKLQKKKCLRQHYTLILL